MSEDRDLYEILGVSETATRDDLAKAYRQLARKYHPDVNKSPDAETKMQEVSAAYDVLSDDSKRREYDEQRKYGAAGSQRPSYPGGSWTGSTGDGYMGYSSPFSSFYAGGGRFDSSNPDVDYGVFNESPRMDYREFAQSNPFSAFSMGSMFGEMPRETGEDSPGALHAALTIDFKTAVEGADEISMSVGSNGRIVKAKLPAGLRDGQTIRLKGRGARVDGAGRKRGDLFIKISVEPDPSGVWSMSADNVLTRTLAVTLSEVALGSQVEVMGWTGKRVRLRLPAGAREGTRLKVPGLGPNGSTAVCVVSILQPDWNDPQVRRVMRSLQEVDKKTIEDAKRERTRR